MAKPKKELGVKVDQIGAIAMIVAVGLLAGCLGTTATTPSGVLTPSFAPTVASPTEFPPSTPEPPRITPTTSFQAATETRSVPTPLDAQARLPSGTYLAFWLDGALYLRALESPLETGLAPIDYLFARMSPDTSRIAFSDQGKLGIYEIMSGEITALPDLQRSNYQPSWSPDGNSLVYVHDDEEMVNSSLFVVNLADGSPTRITSWPTIERAPAWSPDGKWIAFASDRAKIDRTDGSYLGVTEIYILDAGCLTEPLSCNDKAKQITDMGADGDSDSPAWSVDSNQLVFMCGSLLDSGRYQEDICIVRRDGSELHNITNTPENELWPIWSPSGEYIAFTRENPESRTKDVAVIRVSGDQMLLITDTPDLSEVFAFWLVIP